MNTKQWWVGALAGVAIAASLFFLLHAPAEKAELSATNASEALGFRAAAEVAQLVGPHGQIAMAELELSPGQAPSAAASVAAFRQNLKKRGVTVVRTKAITGGLSGLIMGRGIPQKDYLALIENSPTVNAVVTFAGLPDLSPDELHQFQASHPPLIVVDIFGVLKGPTLPALVEQKTVALAFAPRAATELEPQTDERKVFERYYRILSPPTK